jgi:hypothetical protein
MGAPKGMITARNSSSNVAGLLPLTEQWQEKCRAWVHTLDAWHLTANTLFVAWALLDHHQQQQQNQQHEQEETERPHQATSLFVNDLNKAIGASRVEEEFQIRSWGLGEGQHVAIDRTVPCSCTLGTILLADRSLAVDNGWP